ncbi:MAG: ATP-binding cassette domain-containing protein [Terrisporobacter sp.]|uniref:ABC transporter ATP-binding protein n=1 Tax=Terrisporobacter sp. TaxID=1965305 RepID=UPI002FC5AC4B
MSIIELNNVYYKDKKNIVLDGVYLEINKGEAVSIVGESGSGKSTLLKICSDLIEVTSGKIKYNGKDYFSYEPENLRKNISYCIQMPYLFGKTIYDNLEFPFKIRNKEVDKKKISNLLKRFNLEEEWLNKNVESLSGGEKQRVAFIRNIMFTPDVLLLDEVTSALDSTNTKIIEDYVKELNDKGVTILWVTHNKKQSETIFNRRITISKGKVEKVEELN